ncbi:MAG: S-layer homology domain-containing protein [Clostridia bacterium]|nr:S-layer homology domain-containing protein [Clostridia bacterium]
MKKLAVFLALVLVFTGVMPALAAEDISEIVLSVKNRVPISEACTEFDSSRYTKNGDRGYSLYWRTPDNAEDYDFYNVSIDSHKVITSYHWSNGRDYGIYVPKITKEQALIIAIDFFAKANPDISLVYDFNNASVEYYGSVYYVVAQRYEKGLPVYGNSTSIQIDGQSGNVYEMRTLYTHRLTFLEYDNAITTNEAKAAFEKLGGLELVYRSFEKWDETQIARPIYISSGKGLRISALSGEEYTGKQYSDDNLNVSLKNDAMTGLGTEGATLTQKEIAEIEKLTQLITPEEAEAKLKAMPELLLDANAPCSYSTIRKNGKDKYVMNISFEWERGYAEATLNAQTGEITHYYAYDTNDLQTKAYTADMGEAEANAFAEKYLAYYVQNSITDTEEHSVTDVRYRQSRTRVQNGIPYRQNSISVTVDRKTMKVSGFDVNWTEDIVFESLDNAVSSADAYAKFFEYITPELVYYMNGASTLHSTSPVYITELGDIYGICAVNGTPVDNRGELYEKTERTEYTDISGHYAEEYIKALYNTGIGFDGGLFNPDNIITQGEYIALVSDCVMNYAPLIGAKVDMESIYNHAVSMGVVEKDDIDEDAPLTREKAVTYLLRAMDYGAFAEIEGIFKCDFADADSITPELFGYVAIARGLKIISGAEDNNFLPQKQMTRAEAAVILYNYLSK